MMNTPITILLIALNVIVFFVSQSNQKIINDGVLWPYLMKEKKEYYRFISSGFLHADFIHLFFNMFTLFFFGRNIELILKYYELGGNTSFIILYFGSMVVADIPCYLKNQNNPGYRSLGASGAVSGMVFSAVVFNPWGSIYLYGAIKISALLYAILFIAYCIYMGKRSQDNINHDAHLWGALFGFVLTLGIVYVMQPELLQLILDTLKQPSLFGRD